VEITLTIAGFGMMALLYLLFSKLVPMISMWELEAGLRKAPIVRLGSFEPRALPEPEPLATDVPR
jgi:hypothetical protein